MELRGRVALVTGGGSQLAERHISAHAICPGVTDTGMPSEGRVSTSATPGSR